jgi:hypothetical protein
METLKDQTPTVYGDGEQMRDFTFIESVVDANLLAAQPESAARRAFNIATGSPYSVNYVITQLNRLLGKHVQPSLHPGAGRRRQVQYGGRLAGRKAPGAHADGLVRGRAGQNHGLVQMPGSVVAQPDERLTAKAALRAASRLQITT